MIEALKEVLGAAITFISLVSLVFIWASANVLFNEIRNYFKK